MKTTQNQNSKFIAFAAPSVALVLALAIGAFTDQAAAAPPSGGGSAGNSTNSFAVGGISVTTSDHTAFAAQLNTKSGAASGYVVQDLMSISRSGPVTCVTFYGGNKATIGWIVKHSTDSSEIGQFRTFEVTDNGEPVLGMSPDLFLDTMTNYEDCGDMSGGGVMPIHGNIVVKQTASY